MVATSMDDRLAFVPSQQLLERAEVLTELHGLVDALGQGSGRAVSISGEAGIGKTSVLRAFARAIPDRFLLLQGGCDDLMSPRPLGPLFDMARAIDADLLELLASGSGAGDVFNQLLILIQQSRKPVVMVVEDVHWADDATIDLLKFLGRRAVTLPMLLVMSHRNDEPGRAYPVSRLLGALPAPDLRRILLEPLSEAAVTELAQAANRPSAGLHGITSGNPFFVTEILASDTRGLLPSSVRDAVWARIEHCGIEQRVLLEALSILPGGGERGLLEALVTGPQAQEIDGLVDSGMLRTDGHAIRFRHELARLAVLQMIPEGRRSRLHQAASNWYGSQPDSLELANQVERLHHASAAHDIDTILDLTPTAARRAAFVGAHKQAARLLALALPYVDRLAPDQAAQFHESWSYESGLSEQIDDKVIEARMVAIDLWQKAGRIDKVGLNYRWLSRLHWYRGEADQAKHYIDLAVETLVACDPGPELGWAYSVRSQWAMLNDQFDDAISWGMRALDLAERFEEIEIRVHALNNMGTSLLLSTDPARGRALMEESLALALHHHFDEQAARVYTNMTEFALGERDLDLAAQYLEAGIAFDTDHDLDSWLYYLRGCQARYHLLRGDAEAAENLARDILEIPNQTMVMQLPAATVLAHAKVRLGHADAKDSLLAVLDRALGTKEPQRIAPLRIALAEAAWLEGDMTEVAAQAAVALAGGQAVHPWDVGELHCWAARAGKPMMPLPDGLPAPVVEECGGDLQNAADAYGKLGMPFERAIVLHRLEKPRKHATLTEINAIIRGSNSVSSRRGKYAAASAHPAGLTAKEQQVLLLVSEGASNSDIASRLNRSVRTIEHHVSAILDKLGVESRSKAVSKAADFQ